MGQKSGCLASFVGHVQFSVAANRVHGRKYRRTTKKIDMLVHTVHAGIEIKILNDYTIEHAIVHAKLDCPIFFIVSGKNTIDDTHLVSVGSITSVSQELANFMFF